MAAPNQVTTMSERPQTTSRLPSLGASLAVRLAAVSFIPHGTTHIVQDTESSGAAIPTAPGLAGGYPATTNYYQFKRNSDILQRHAQRRMIGDISEAQGQDELLQLRQIDIHQGPADVYDVAFAAGAGYGDP